MKCHINVILERNLNAFLLPRKIELLVDLTLVLSFVGLLKALEKLIFIGADLVRRYII